MATQTESNGLNLLKDVVSFGPAPTPGRELVAAVINLAVLGVLFAVIGPHPVMIAVILASLAYFVIRFAIGTRRWSDRHRRR